MEHGELFQMKYFHELKLRLRDMEVGVVSGQDGPTLDGCTC